MVYVIKSAHFIIGEKHRAIAGFTKDLPTKCLHACCGVAGPSHLWYTARLVHKSSKKGRSVHVFVLRTAQWLQEKMLCYRTNCPLVLRLHK